MISPPSILTSGDMIYALKDFVWSEFKANGPGKVPWTTETARELADLYPEIFQCYLDKHIKMKESNNT